MMRAKTLLAIVILALCSCKVNRNVQKFTRTVDSTGFFKKDSVAVKRVDSSATIGTVKVTEVEKKSDYQKVTVIEQTPEVKRITITETDKGVKKVTTKTVTKDSAGLKKVDSIAFNSRDTVAVQIKESGKEKQSTKTQGGTWINIGLALLGVIVLAGVGYYLYKKYWR